MALLSRIEWYFRRRKLQRQVSGFKAGLRTFASRDVVFSENVVLHGSTCISSSHIGRFTYFAGTIASNVKIGSFCSIGPGTRIGGMGSHPVNMLSTHPAFYSTRGQAGMTFSDMNYFEEIKVTHIGNDVWVGANAIVLDGVSIGNGAVVAAGAVVTSSVPDYAIVGGVPAKVLKMRFCEEDIRQLNQIQWWNFPIETLNRIAPAMRSGNVKLLFEAIN